MLTDKAATKVKTLIGFGKHKRKRILTKKVILRKVRKVITPDIFFKHMSHSPRF